MANEPKVFISYSHDSPDHKRWVADFASRLRKAGIDAILDQWDLSLGEDVTKFMERAVTEADRVLMICTEPYVRKVDDGQGGAGYEAMIVTGELIKNLGSSKFIPVVRQDGPQSTVPRFLGTRVWINFSEGQDVESAYEQLLRELHKAPLTPKPPLGENPFALEHAAAAPSRMVRPPASGAMDPPVELYQEASALIETRNQVEWRRLVKITKLPVGGRLIEWRQKWLARQGISDAELPEMVMEALAVYEPIFSVALAGVESGQPAFNNQSSLIDELLHPKNWDASGWTCVLDTPQTIAFFYQALHGAVCVDTDQFQLAIELARTNVKPRGAAHSAPICRIPGLIGWPSSLGSSAGVAWKLLLELPKKWAWLTSMFVSEDDYRVALGAYYMALNIHELALSISRGQEELLKNQKIQLEIPLTSHLLSQDDRQRAYLKLLRCPDQLRKVWQRENVSDEQMKQNWPMWVSHSASWILRATSHNFFGEMAHAHLFDELPPAP